MTVPRSGPSTRPMPPITVMKMTLTVQSLMLKAEKGVIGASAGRSSRRPSRSRPPRRRRRGAWCPVDVDAVRLRRGLVVADGGERQAVARAQEHDDEPDDGDRQGEEDPVDDASRVSRVAAIALTIAAGRLMPEPPPTAGTCCEEQRKISAMTQEPMVK